MTYKNGKFILNDGHEVPVGEAYQIANLIDKLDLRETITEKLEDTKYDISQLSENAIDALVSGCRKALINDEDELSDIIFEIASGMWKDLEKATSVSKSENFEFAPGYYEWNLSYGDNILCSAEDFSEIMNGVNSSAEVRDISENTLECLIANTEGEISKENINILKDNKNIIIDVMTEALCNHYDIPNVKEIKNAVKDNNNLVK